MSDILRNAVMHRCPKCESTELVLSGCLKIPFMAGLQSDGTFGLYIPDYHRAETHFEIADAIAECQRCGMMARVKVSFKQPYTLVIDEWGEIVYEENSLKEV